MSRHFFQYLYPENIHAILSFIPIDVTQGCTDWRMKLVITLVLAAAHVAVAAQGENPIKLSISEISMGNDDLR